MLDFFLYYIGFGGVHFVFLFFITPLALYALLRVWILLVRGAREEMTFKEVVFDLGKSFGAFFILLATVIGFMLLFAVFLEPAARSSPENILRNVNYFLEVDRAMWGSLPYFDLHREGSALKVFFDALSPILIGSYLSLTTVFCFALLSSLMYDAKLFTKLFLAFFLCAGISLPIWFLMPTISPFEAYVDNILRISETELPFNRGAFQPNELLLAMLQWVRSLRGGCDDCFYAVTAFPSMHVAWAFVLTYFAASWRRIVLPIFLIYFFFNLFATFYTLQHFVIDVFPGILVGVLAIFIVRFLVDQKKWVPWFAQELHGAFKEDFAWIFNRGRGIYRKMRS